MKKRQFALAMALLSISSTLCLRLMRSVGEKLARDGEPGLPLRKGEKSDKAADEAQEK